MNSYDNAVQYLMQRLPAFSHVGSVAMKEGLGNITLLCSALGDPQLKFPTVHIAGTNGKGSTSHMIAAALQRAGYKTGLYTSPHLVDLRERIRINGKLVSKEFVVQFLEKTRESIEQVSPSYFEVNVAMAFTAFAEEQVDIAVIETGLGGRLDSTNIITPLLSVITNIDLDHTQILGSTRAEIAAEKAGIIKEKVPVVVGETHEETEPVFFRHALAKHTSIVYADTLWDMVRVGQDGVFQYFKAFYKPEQELSALKTDLLGTYQSHNIKTALTACQLLQQMGWNLPLQQVMESMASVKRATGLRGRWDRVQRSPDIILDVAHNPAGMQFLIQNLEALWDSTGKQGGISVVCGFVRDKDVEAALKLFPSGARFYFCAADVPRALPAVELKQIADKLGLTGDAYPSVDTAVHAARKEAAEDDTVLVTGSFFIVGEAMTALEESI